MTGHHVGRDGQQCAAQLLAYRALLGSASPRVRATANPIGCRICPLDAFGMKRPFIYGELAEFRALEVWFPKVKFWTVISAGSSSYASSAV
jgi:hypothetical protein